MYSLFMPTDTREAALIAGPALHRIHVSALISSPYELLLATLPLL